MNSVRASVRHRSQIISGVIHSDTARVAHQQSNSGQFRCDELLRLRCADNHDARIHRAMSSAMMSYGTVDVCAAAPTAGRPNALSVLRRPKVVPPPPPSSSKS